MPDATRGHAVRPHTADVRIEGWGPTPAACLEEAVEALAAVWAQVPGETRSEPRRFAVPPGPLADQAVLVLEEVIAVLDIEGLVARRARITRCDEDRGTAGELDLVPLDAVEVVGPGPKGVARSGLRFGVDAEAWRCEATIDV